MTRSNIIQLPTAAVRRVCQPNGRVAREHRAAFREENPWPGRYLWPAQRDEEQRRSDRQRLFTDMTMSPELAILLVLLRTTPSNKIEAIRFALDLFPSATESLALVQARAVVDLAAESRRALEEINLFGKERQ
jgi:hypothetical protein